MQDGTNWYVYCNNNPLSFVDPTGLMPGISYFMKSATQGVFTALGHVIDKFGFSAQVGAKAQVKGTPLSAQVSYDTNNDLSLKGKASAKLPSLGNVGDLNQSSSSLKYNTESGEFNGSQGTTTLRTPKASYGPAKISGAIHNSDGDISLSARAEIGIFAGDTVDISVFGDVKFDVGEFKNTMQEVKEHREFQKGNQGNTSDFDSVTRAAPKQEK